MESYFNSVWNLFNPDIQYHEDPQVPMLYLLTKLHIETTELYEKVKDNDGQFHQDYIDEAGDIWWYMCNLCQLPNVNYKDFVIQRVDINKSFHDMYTPEHMIDTSYKLMLHSKDLLQNYIKLIYHHKTDKFSNEHLINFLTDLYMMTPYIDSIQNILQFNIDKLTKRYGEYYGSSDKQ